MNMPFSVIYDLMKRGWSSWKSRDEEIVFEELKLRNAKVYQGVNNVVYIQWKLGFRLRSLSPEPTGAVDCGVVLSHTSDSPFEDTNKRVHSFQTRVVEDNLLIEPELEILTLRIDSEGRMSFVDSEGVSGLGVPDTRDEEIELRRSGSFYITVRSDQEVDLTVKVSSDNHGSKQRELQLQDLVQKWIEEKSGEPISSYQYGSIEGHQDSPLSDGIIGEDVLYSTLV